MEHVYQHYRKEEQPFINQVMGWIQQVEDRYAPYLSTFLTPREVMIIKQLIGRVDSLSLKFYGGYENAERKRVLIYPDYYEPTYDDFELSVLNVNFPKKFAQLTHGRILGSLMSTGIERERVGDIITDNEAWHIVIDSSMVEYIIQQVDKIANVGVYLEKIDVDQILESSENWETVTIITSSLRLDTLLSKVYNFSRQRAKNSISSKLVKVNFVEVYRNDIEIGENDIVSLRKFGRFWISSIDGVTKKNNYRLTINKLMV